MTATTSELNKQQTTCKVMRVATKRVSSDEMDVLAVDVIEELEVLMGKEFLDDLVAGAKRLRSRT